MYVEICRYPAPDSGNAVAVEAHMKLCRNQHRMRQSCRAQPFFNSLLVF